MRFNAKAYEELYPRQDKLTIVDVPEDIDPEDQMVEVPKKEVKEKEAVEDGIRTDGEPDTE